MKTMTLGGIEIPLLASLDHNVSDSSARRETIHPMGDGSNLKQVYAGTQKKGQFTLDCQGVIPPGLDGLDTTGALVLQLASERSITSSSNVIALPTTRRTDSGYEPWGRAIVGNECRETSISVVADVATLGVVAGAELYQVLWYPKLTVYTVGDIEKVTDVNGAMVSWRLGLVEK